MSLRSCREVEDTTNKTRFTQLQLQMWGPTYDGGHPKAGRHIQQHLQLSELLQDDDGIDAQLSTPQNLQAKRDL